MRNNYRFPRASEPQLRAPAGLAPKAIEKTLAELPAGFPEQLTASIIGGFRHRLSTLEQTAKC